MFHFPHYVLISCLECSCGPNFCWNFDKTLPLWFAFGGTISIVPRQGGGSTGVFIWGIILVILLELERVCGASLGRTSLYFCIP